MRAAVERDLRLPWEEPMKTIFACVCAVLALVGLDANVARAQDYPTKPVKILIAFPVGGLLDTVSRIVGEKMSGLLGQQFVIEARPGAGGTLATQAVARAEPDGYTLMMINDNHSINPSVFKNMPYDSVKDFAPIGFVGSAPMVLAVHAGLPHKSVKELIDDARARPSAITYGSVGIGSASHLAGEMFADIAGIKMTHVPYRGGAPALQDLTAGHLNTMFTSAVVSMPHIEAGRLRALAVAAPQRLPVMPNLPTMAEVGYPVEAVYWFGLVAPAGTPAPIIAKLEKTLAEVLAMPDVKKRLTDMGGIVTPLRSREFGDYIRTEMTRWQGVVTKANVKIE
jgi:tripartite-type tricarboxylate transporter receptor subunit TctC